MPRIVPVLVFALTFPTLMTWLYFTQAHSAMKAAYAVGKIIQFSLPVAWWTLADRGRLRWPRLSPAGLWVGLAFGLAVAAGISVLYFTVLAGHPALEAAGRQARAKTSAFGLGSPGPFIAFAVFLAVVHALMEEYYWRAFVFGELRRITKPVWAIVISSLGFMAHHVIVLHEYFPGHFWSATLPFSLAIAAGGAVWAWMLHRYESIGPAWLSHALVDVGIMVVGFELTFR